MPLSGRAVYVHVPFCEQKCAYCDFFTITDPERRHPLFHDWLNLCLREMELWVEKAGLEADVPIATVFFGGGTPSLLDAELFRNFLEKLRSQYGFTTDCEITLETQPGTVTTETLLQYADAGINRFSIGVQTFNPALLEHTGRRHCVNDARQTILGAQATGKVVSIDLIAALPNQTSETWNTELDEALEFSPDHISVYELTFHAGTEYHRRLRKGELQEAGEDARIAMFEMTRDRLINAGYEHYEISNYARPGKRSRHNQNYWELGDFLGLGAGAHSFIFPHRYANPNAAQDYARALREGRLFRRPSETADPDVRLVENLQMALRLLEGVDLAAFSARFGEDVMQSRRQKLDDLQQAGLVTLNGTRLQLTPEGQLRSDSVVEHLL